MVSYRKNAFEYEILVNNREELEQDREAVVDRITLEELLLFLVKGEYLEVKR